ncbi:hypothetical protein V6O07_17950, partial [Arthrospira platensis SPKY2]
DQADLRAEGDFVLQALESARVSADLSGSVESNEDATTQANDSGGDGLAVGGLIATNLVLSSARAEVLASQVTSGGDITIAADNLSSINATNSASMSSDGSA